MCEVMSILGTALSVGSTMVGYSEQKKQAALEIATSALKMADAISNKNIVHAEAFSAGLSLLIDGVVACLNASVWAKS